MILPIPGVRKECTRCYQLLHVMQFTVYTNIEPYYMLGSNIPEFVQRTPQTCTVKAFCGGCFLEIEREYIERQGTFTLIRESLYQDERMA